MMNMFNYTLTDDKLIDFVRCSHRTFGVISDSIKYIF